MIVTDPQQHERDVCIARRSAARWDAARLDGVGGKRAGAGDGKKDRSRPLGIDRRPSPCDVWHERPQAYAVCLFGVRGLVS